MKKSSLAFGLNVKPSFTIGRRKVVNPLLEEQEDEEAEIPTHSKSKTILIQEMHEKALKEDENVFDYDAVYDNIKKKEFLKKQEKDGHKKPKYMENLILSSQKRKQEFQKVRERELEKQRELEKELYGETEVFVTEAYKERMATLQKEKAKQREIEEQEENATKDMTGFYRVMMKQQLQSRSIENIEENELPSSEPIITSVVKQVEPQKGLLLNDSEEVVDKRQLLSGGLNIRERTPKKQKLDTLQADLAEITRLESVKKKESQRRQQELQLQYEKSKNKTEERQLQEENNIVKVLTESVSSQSVSDARARYLARKTQKLAPNTAVL
jgi:hypothetical protein